MGGRGIRRRSRFSRPFLVASTMAALLAALACDLEVTTTPGGTVEPTTAPPTQPPPTTPPPTLMPTTRPLPGAGKPVQPAFDSLPEGLFQHEVLFIGLERLGYEVQPILGLDVPSLHRAIGQGKADFTAVHWHPLQEPYLEQADGADQIQHLGKLVEDTQRGYLVDKATADAHAIDSIVQLRDPTVAKLFDADGNGKADLSGCNPGWSCEEVIEHHLDAFDLRDTVEHKQRAYFTLMEETIARFQQGEPILYYTWTPLWVSAVLKPGTEVEWLEVPATAPSDEAPVTALPDGAMLDFEPNTITVIANQRFLDDNPAAKRLFELASIPIMDVNEQNLRMQEGEDSSEEIRRHAERWVGENKEAFEDWVQEAVEAAS